MAAVSGWVLAGSAAVAAGAINALAGGGTLLTFPTLTALGLPALDANVTNTVALFPGYVGAVAAQRSDLAGQRRRLLSLLPAALAGGLVGAALALTSGERLFRAVVPFLILFASALLAAQDWVRGLVAGHGGDGESRGRGGWAAVAVGVASVYGGYFGAGLSVILLAVLGVAFDDTLTRLNAQKQALSGAANLGAAVVFVASGRVAWPMAAAMAVGAVVGGALGGKLAGRISPRALRIVVVAVGTIVGIAFLVR